MRGVFRIGTAGWTIPKACVDAFPREGSHIRRYAGRLSAVEINSSFHRSHRPATYARWADSVPPNFRFAVKMPREITHRRKLAEAGEPLERFLAEIASLGERLGPVLVQLPPSLALDACPAPAFFAALRERFPGDVVLEPRHPSWFVAESNELLLAHRIARVAADPAPVPQAAEPGGWPGLVYYRLHGAPRVYYSAYSEDDIAGAAARMLGAARKARQVWCIFDNTALGEAWRNALDLAHHVTAEARAPAPA